MDDDLAELRRNQVRHERELGVVMSGHADLKTDVDALADDLRKTRHDLRNQIQASEGRVIAEMREEFDKREARETATLRWRVGTALAIVSAILIAAGIVASAL